MFAAVLTMGLVVGLALGQGGTPAFAQDGGDGSKYMWDQIESIDEETDSHDIEGRTFAVVTPRGELKLVRISWQMKRGDENTFAQRWGAAGPTHRVELLDAGISLAD
jgi:hypothetical protein